MKCDRENTAILLLIALAVFPVPLNLSCKQYNYVYLSGGYIDILYISRILVKDDVK